MSRHHDCHCCQGTCSCGSSCQWRRSCRVLGSWPPLSGSGGPNVHGPPLFSAMLLYMACNPYQFCRQWLNSACTLISVVHQTSIVYWKFVLTGNDTRWRSVSSGSPLPEWTDFWPRSYNRPTHVPDSHTVWLYKLDQKFNFWQRVCGLCPDPLESPREGKEERRIEAGREVAWTGTPQDVWQIAASGSSPLTLVVQCSIGLVAF